MNLGELLPLFAHRRGFGRHNFGADRPVNRRADLPQHLGVWAPGLRQQARIGGHTVRQTPTDGFTNFAQVGGVNKKFHFVATSGRRVRGRNSSARANVTRCGDLSWANSSEMVLFDCGWVSDGASSAIGASTKRRS